MSSGVRSSVRAAYVVPACSCVVTENAETQSSVTFFLWNSICCSFICRSSPRLSAWSRSTEIDSITMSTSGSSGSGSSACSSA